MIAMSELQKNLDAAWSRVEQVDHDLGAGAYVTYNRTMRNYAEHYGLGFVQTVEAFVALSPNNDYHGNLRSLAGCMQAAAAGCASCDHVTVTTYNACRDRAYSYLRGDVSFSDTVSGPKIIAFRDNILYPRKSKRATIDGHMIAIMMGRDMTMKEASRAIQYTPHAFLESEFVKFCRRVKTPVPTVQAVLWTSRKRRLDINFTTQGDLFNTGLSWDQPLTPEHCPPYPQKGSNHE